MRIEAPQRRVKTFGARDSDPLHSLQIFRQRGAGVGLREIKLARQLFGHDIQRLEVVVDEMKEVAHLLIRSGLDQSPKALGATVHAGELFRCATVGVVGEDQRARDGGRVLRDELQLL